MMYKGMYIQEEIIWDDKTKSARRTDRAKAVDSPSGLGYCWKSGYMSLHACKIAVTKYLKTKDAQNG